jgi:hypothetical protein
LEEQKRRETVDLDAYASMTQNLPYETGFESRNFIEQAP